MKVIPTSEIYNEFGHGSPTPFAIQNLVANTLENWKDPKPQYLLLVGDATTDYLGHNEDLDDALIPSLMVPVMYSGETVSDSRLADVNNDMIPDIAVGRWPVRKIEDVIPVCAFASP